MNNPISLHHSSRLSTNRLRGMVNVGFPIINWTLNSICCIYPEREKSTLLILRGLLGLYGDLGCSWVKLSRRENHVILPICILPSSDDLTRSSKIRTPETGIQFDSKIVRSLRFSNFMVIFSEEGSKYEMKIESSHQLVL